MTKPSVFDQSFEDRDGTEPWVVLTTEVFVRNTLQGAVFQIDGEPIVDKRRDRGQSPLTGTAAAESESRGADASLTSNVR